MTAISMRQRTFWLWDSQLLPVERWSDLDGRKLAQAHLREAGKPTREGGRPLGLPMGRLSTPLFIHLANELCFHLEAWQRPRRQQFDICCKDELVADHLFDFMFQRRQVFN